MSGSRGELLAFVLNVDGDVSRDVCCGSIGFTTPEGREVGVLFVGAFMYGI